MKEEEVEAQAQKLLSKLDEYSNIIPKITPQREFIHAAFVGIPKGIKGLPGQRVALHFVVDAEFRDEALSVLDSTDIPVKIIIQKWNGEKVE